MTISERLKAFVTFEYEKLKAPYDMGTDSTDEKAVFALGTRQENTRLAPVIAATIFGAILIEGDESAEEASKYVKRHLSFSCEAECVDGEINEQQIIVEHAFEEHSKTE